MTLLQCLHTQRRVLGALILRELKTRYGRDNFGFLWFMFEPLVFMIGVLILWRLLRGPYDHRLPVIAIVMLGYAPLLLWRHIISRSMIAIRPNVGLLYHRQVTVLDVIISRIVVEIAGNILAFMFCYAVLIALDLVHLPADPGLMLLGYFHMVLFSTGLGLTIGALSERSDVVERIWTPIPYIANAVIGAYVLAAWLPEHLRELYLTIPTVHAFEMFRGGYFGEEVRSFYSQAYIGAWSAILIFLGLHLLKDARRYLRLE